MDPAPAPPASASFPGEPRVRRALALLLGGDVPFVAGVLAALVWANVDLASYSKIAGEARFFVNEVLMALFFGVAAKEVRAAMLPGGPLATARRAALPLVATVGGMAGPALVYLGLALALGRRDLALGWAIPTATDVAFCAIVARAVFGAKHPAVPFLLLLAIADDAGGLAIIALAYPHGEVRPLPLAALVLAGAGVAVALRALRVRSPWPYLVLAGAPSWAGLHLGGVHPALALVPIVPFLPHEGESGESTLDRLEAALASPVSLVLGAFGLANAGVPLAAAGTATWLVLAGLVLGKPLGIGSGVLAGRAFGLELPEGMRARDVLVLGATASVGFTVALFVATVAFAGREAGEALDAAKMGALGSVAAAPVAIVLGRLAGVARRT